MKLLICVYFFSLCWLFQKILLQIFTLDFHKNTFQERMDINKDTLKTLNILNEARKQAMKIDPNILTAPSENHLNAGYQTSKQSNSKLSQNENTPGTALAAGPESVPNTEKTPQMKGDTILKSIKISNSAKEFAAELGHRAAMVVTTAVGMDVGANKKYQGGHFIDPNDVRTRHDAKNFAVTLYKALLSFRAPPNDGPSPAGLTSVSISQAGSLPNLSAKPRPTLINDSSALRSSVGISKFLSPVTAFTIAPTTAVGLTVNTPATSTPNLSTDQSVSKSNCALNSPPPRKANFLHHNGLLLDDFVTFFGTKEDAKYAFSLFDRNSSGSISKREFKETVQEIYEEKWGLEKSLQSSSEAIRKLDGFLFFIVVSISILISLGIWNVNVDALIGSIAAIWLGIAFAVGETFTKLFSNLIFIFVSHPFDCGDLIEYSNEQYTVKEFFTMHTLLIRYDGKHVYAPNYELSLAILVNNRRSAPVRKEIELICDYDTVTPQKVELLQKAMDEFTLTHAEDFIPNQKLKGTLPETFSNSITHAKSMKWRNASALQPFEPYGVWIYFDNFKEGNKIVLKVVYYHKTNEQNRLKSQVRSSKFHAALMDAIEIVGIELDDDLTYNINLNK